ncbi:MAG: bifunctional oligoribonuclease/PAP phosphatase NrnA [Nitrospirae bacterium]|nr:bifunctional oligoribonuclease/PAP phosphatase NrnA [Nitrospirota bacterium]
MATKTAPDARAVVEAMKAFDTFAVSTHVNPEGDALGSAIALALALRAAGKKADVVIRDHVPAYLDFLPYHGVVVPQNRTLPLGYDVLAVVDCGDLDRTGLFPSSPPPVKLVVNIDHHMTNRGFGGLNWVVPDATASGQMVYELMLAWGIPVSRDMALCLYTTLLSETGSFRYSNTKPSTLRVAADLLECGVESAKVAQALYERNSPGRLQLLGEVLRSLERHEGGKIAWVTVTHESFRKTGTSAEDTEEMVNYPRSLKGVEVALLFREVTPTEYKISLRSQGRVNVATVAEGFGGGGHRNAAGCMAQGDLQSVRARMLSAVAAATAREAP